MASRTKAGRGTEKGEAGSQQNDHRAVSRNSEADAVDDHDTADDPGEANGAQPEDSGEDEGEVKISEQDEDQNPFNHSSNDGTAETPPLPEETIPPLPTEEPPAATGDDDGWAPIWEESAQAFYFYNRFTGATQWTNPRVPEASQPGPPGVTPAAYSPPAPTPTETPPVTGYNPAIHGDYDPTAWYAQPAAAPETATSEQPTADAAAQYTATAHFNRFTGRFQDPSLNPENFNDEHKSRRQMNAIFDVDAAANNHDGRSLKAERSGKKLSKTELKQFKEKRKAKKEEKRRAWLRD